MGAAHTTATAPRQPMAALARGLGAACRISVARLRPAESDVRSMSSTRSKTVGAVRQVRGGAEAGFWVGCWVARGGARQLAAAPVEFAKTSSSLLTALISYSGRLPSAFPIGRGPASFSLMRRTNVLRGQRSERER